jgi:nicotinamidase-related amidase
MKVVEGARPTSEQNRRFALLVADLQVGFCCVGEECVAPPLAVQTAERQVIKVAAAVQEAALRAGIPVVQTRLAFDPTYFTRTNRTARFDRYPAERLLSHDSPAAQIVSELQSQDAVLVTKGCVDPLVGTTLPAMLAANGITDLFIGGVATNLAVESAARHAADMGIGVRVVEDMCASSSSDLHEFAMANTLPLFAQIVSSNDAITLLGGDE